MVAKLVGGKDEAMNTLGKVVGEPHMPTGFHSYIGENMPTGLAFRRKFNGMNNSVGQPQGYRRQCLKGIAVCNVSHGSGTDCIAVAFRGGASGVK